MIVKTHLKDGRSVDIKFDASAAIREKEAIKRRANKTIQDNRSKNSETKKKCWMFVMGITAFSLIVYPLFYAYHILWFNNIDVLLFACAVSIFLCILALNACRSENLESVDKDTIVKNKSWDTCMRYLDHVHSGSIVGVRRVIKDDSDSPFPNLCANVIISVEKQHSHTPKLKTMDEVSFYPIVKYSHEVEHETFNVDENVYYVPYRKSK